MEYGFLLEILQPEISVILNLSLRGIISFKGLNEFQSIFCAPPNSEQGEKYCIQNNKLPQERSIFHNKGTLIEY